MSLLLTSQVQVSRRDTVVKTLILILSTRVLLKSKRLRPMLMLKRLCESLIELLIRLMSNHALSQASTAKTLIDTNQIGMRS